MKRKHADLAIEYFSDDSAKFQIRQFGVWVDTDNPEFNPRFEYRRKPKSLKCKIALMKGSLPDNRDYLDIEESTDSGKLSEKSNFIGYKTDWIEIDI